MNLPAKPHERPTADLLMEAFDEARDVLKLEAKLARQEIGAALKSGFKAGVAMGVAVACCVASVALLSLALALAMGATLSVACGVAGALLLAVACAGGVFGYRSLHREFLGKVKGTTDRAEIELVESRAS